MKFKAEWMVCNSITGTFKGIKELEAYTIEEALSKCKKLVVMEDFKGIHQNVRVINVQFNK